MSETDMNQIQELIESSWEALGYLFHTQDPDEKEAMREILAEAIGSILNVLAGHGMSETLDISEFIASLLEGTPDHAAALLEKIEFCLDGAAEMNEDAENTERSPKPEESEAEQIKLVIWDLDDTFWVGTLAEDGAVIIPQSSISIIKELTSRGIVNSICSKNDFESAQTILKEAQVWDYFVFPHIAFTLKGEAIEHIITDMQLRSPNVMFIDDNRSNLEEALFYNPGIQIMPAQEIDRLLGMPGTKGKPDPEHTRLGQYKMLESRRNFRNDSDDNDAFLRNSEIHVRINPTKPQDAERVHDMIMRTNQLNFTKKRISLDEVDKLLRDPDAESATIHVYDRFGDHGVVGWYCLSEGELVHFLFSCRIINLGIEQFVYALLGFPRLNIVGDTASSVSADDTVPNYITLDDNRAEPPISQPSGADKAIAAKLDKLQIYALGACDLYYMVAHMALPLTSVHFECNTFNGDTRGVNVATEYIRSCFEMSEKSKAFCRAHFHNYTGRTAFDTKIFDKKYDFVCLSFHDDFALDIYRNNEFPKMRIVLSNSESGSFTPILNPEGIKDFNGQEWLSQKFTQLGLITPERFRENLEWIMGRLPKQTHMILMTGPEYDFFRETEPHNAAFREQVIRLNRIIRAFCTDNQRASLVEMNDVIFERGHFTDFLMHINPERGYTLAMKMMEVMAEHPSDMHWREQMSAGARRLVLWCDYNTLTPNFLSLCAGGARPDEVVVTSTPESGSIQKQSLNGQSGKYFVILPPGKGCEERRGTLDSYGYRSGADYIELVKEQFTLEWRE